MTGWQSASIARPQGDGLLWIDDLRHLGPGYLADYFRPTAQGIAPRTLALALRGADPAVADHVLTHIDAGLAAALLPYGAEPAPHAEILEAQLQVVTVYFWEMAYHGYPEVYERFSALQQPPLEEMFPTAEYQGREVLDVGTGGGRVLHHLAGHAARLYGVDPCAPLLRVAQAKLPRAVLSQGGFDRIPLPDASVDEIVSHGAYQVSEERGGLSGLAEVRRLLRPGGRARLAVASARTADYLRRAGIREIPVRGAIGWRAPSADDVPLLRHLLRLAQVRYGDDGRARTPIWLFETTA